MAEAKNRVIRTETDVDLCMVCAPLPPEAVWEIESLLLRVLEYGDYSFRSALSGKYSGALRCTFFLARHGANLVGAAGCLYGRANPAISVLGPVAVAPEYRGNGIGTRLVKSVVGHLEDRDCMAIYLGVSDNSPARGLYSRLGFQKYKGILMRYLFCPEDRFEQLYFGKDQAVKIRKVQWGDFPGVQALTCLPCSMYTFDIGRDIFSSKYVEPGKFLSVFPEMMRITAQQGGLADVLVTGRHENVVGVGHIIRHPGEAREHVGELDFFVHDDFLSHSETLVRATLEGAASLSLEKVNCRCLACDRLKRDVLAKLGAKQVAVLPGNAQINNVREDILVYEL
ncbi:MAG: GNAT family N-acetyltransferase [Planctomycetota bacterium]